MPCLDALLSRNDRRLLAMKKDFYRVKPLPQCVFAEANAVSTLARAQWCNLKTFPGASDSAVKYLQRLSAETR